MRRMTIQMTRPNDKGRETIRYRWELLWSEHTNSILVVERYGWKGTTSFSWMVHATELDKHMAGRFSRFEFTPSNGDRLTVTANETRPSLEIDILLREWRNDSDIDWKISDGSLHTFLNMDKVSRPNPEFMNTVDEQFSALALSYGIGGLTGVVSPGLEAAKKHAEQLMPTEPEREEPKVANWGAW